jgi:hypothetical protein
LRQNRSAEHNDSAQGFFLLSIAHRVFTSVGVLFAGAKPKPRKFRTARRLRHDGNSPPTADPTRSGGTQRHATQYPPFRHNGLRLDNSRLLMVRSTISCPRSNTPDCRANVHVSSPRPASLHEQPKENLSLSTSSSTEIVPIAKIHIQIHFEN